MLIRNATLALAVILLSLQQLSGTGSYAGGDKDDKTGVNRTDKDAGSTQGEKKSLKPGQYYKRNQREFKSVDLNKIPYLPDLPFYTGANLEFAWGEEFPNVTGGKVVTYVFYTTDTQYTVLKWYQRYLEGGGWTVEHVWGDDDKSTTGGISAFKERNVCRVQTQREDNQRMEVRIHYHAANAT